MATFEHFAPDERILDDRIYPQDHTMKPKGLWFSAADEAEHRWQDWCTSEGFRLEGLEFRHTFDLDMSSILHIDSDQGIDDFAAAYKGKGEVSHHLGGFYSKRLWEIDWPRVSTEFKGILIQPYSWKQRMSDHMWYYGWDCSSGCVWDKSAILNWKGCYEVPKIENLGKF